MSTALEKQAIEAAINCDWDKAIEVNQQILRADKEDVEALNRLANAYANSGDLKKAKESTAKVLKLDPINSIALRASKKWRAFSSNGNGKFKTASGHDFLEEPGKTKLVKLINVGEKKVLDSLLPGQEVLLVCSNHRVCVNTSSNKYLGRFADDLAARVKKFMGKGNEYKAFVKFSTSKEIVVFVREIKRAEEIAHIPSFPANL